jgi:hypothetical protein
MPDAASSSFETLLARLISDSCGLSQSELLRLFCRTVQECFGPSGVCCCRASRDASWRILESAGQAFWGRSGEFVSAAADALEQAERTRKAALCSGSWLEILRRKHSCRVVVAIPLRSQNASFGAALAGWPNEAVIDGAIL